MDTVDKISLKIPLEGSLQPLNDGDPLRLYYRPLIGWFYRKRLELGLSALTNPSYQRILDVGCGSGIMLPSLSGLSKQVVALDLAQNLVQVKSFIEDNQLSASIATADVTRIPMSSNSFDAVISLSVLEHLPEVKTAIQECMRVLKPGGELVIGMPAVNIWMNRALQILAPKVNMDEEHLSPPSEAICELQKYSSSIRLYRIPKISPQAMSLYTVMWCQKPKY